MEGNSINSFENLCKIFEMRIKLDKEKGVKTSLDVFSNYEKYTKKIDSVYNSDFQEELKPLISPAVTLEKEESRLRRLIKLLEERLDRRIELEDRFYNSTGKYISGLQMIVSEEELDEKKQRLLLISNYLETSKEIDSVTESVNKLKDSLIDEENKKEEYESKNKIMEDELYSSFVSVIKDDNYYKNINEEDINSQLDEIRSKVSETKETLDITKESIGSLITSGLEDDYTSYVEEAERSYYNYKNKELILKIYKLVINFEDDFKLMCAKREKISKLIEEKKLLEDSLSIDTENELLSFEKTLLLQIKSLDDEREVLENITNYNSRIKFKEERLEELKEINSSAEILVILREYGLVDTYEADEINEEIYEEDNIDEIPDIQAQDIELPKLEEPIMEVAYDPYRIVEVKDYPKTLNVGLAKLKGESVREKVNKKLNPKEASEVFTELNLEVLKNDSNANTDDNSMDNKNIELNNNMIVDNFDTENINIPSEIEESVNTEVEQITSFEEPKAETPVWELPTTETIPNSIDFEKTNTDNILTWNVTPSFEVSNNQEEISNIDIISKLNDNSDISSNSNDNMFWIPVSDSKLETKDFPNINIPINNKENNNFEFPTINN